MNSDYQTNGNKRNGDRSGSEICLDGTHMLSRLFPATLGRQLRDRGSSHHENCPSCRAEVMVEADKHRHYVKLLGR